MNDPDHDARVDQAAARERLDAMLDRDQGGPLLEVRRARRIAGLWIGVAPCAALLLALVSWFAGSLEVASLVPLAAFLALPLGLYGRRLWSDAVCSTLVPLVIRAAGGEPQKPDATEEPGLARLQPLGLCRDWSEARIAVGYTGRHRGTEFSFLHVSLHRSEAVTRSLRSRRQTRIFDRGAARRKRTVFNGLLIQVQTPCRVPRTLMNGSRHLFGLLPQRLTPPPDMRPAVLGDPVFDRRFRLWSTRPAQIDSVVVPRLAGLLVDLKASAGHAGFDAAFEAEVLLLLVPRPAVGADIARILGVSGADRRHAHAMLDQALTPHRLIDMLIGDQGQPSCHDG